MGVAEKVDGKPTILMRRTGSSKPLERPETTPRPARDDKVLVLDGPRTLRPWVEQTKRMAAGLNCLDVLGTREIIPRGAAPRSESEWLRRLRTETVQHIVLSRITPAVFAYMRVLGYNSICGDNAAETYDYAKLAAGRMHVPYNTGGGKGASGSDQCASEEEVDRMLWEWQFSSRDSYPSQIPYDQAIAWLGSVLERRAETDERVREILETFHQQDRKSTISVALTDSSDLHERSARKRKSRDVEAGSPCQGEERKMKKPRSTHTEEHKPLDSGKEQLQPPRKKTAQLNVNEATRHPMQPRPHPIPQQPGERSNIPKTRPRLHTHTLVYPERPHNGAVSLSAEGAAFSEQMLDTGLLTPRDLKSEPPEF